MMPLVELEILYVWIPASLVPKSFTCVIIYFLLTLKCSIYHLFFVVSYVEFSCVDATCGPLILSAYVLHGISKINFARLNSCY